MKYIIALVISLVAANAYAGCYTQRYGNQTYTNCGDGYSSNTQTYGNMTYGSDNQGNNCTEQRYGNQTYTNCY
jgi:hypothetical protein